MGQPHKNTSTGISYRLDFENVRTMAENGDEEAEALLPIWENAAHSDEE